MPTTFALLPEPTLCMSLSTETPPTTGDSSVPETSRTHPLLVDSVSIHGHPLLARGCVAMMNTFPELAGVPIHTVGSPPAPSDTPPTTNTHSDTRATRILVLVSPPDWTDALRTCRAWQNDQPQLALLAAITPDIPGTTLSRLLRLDVSAFLMADAPESEWQTAIRHLQERRTYRSHNAERLIAEANRSTVIRVLDYLAPDRLRGRKREVLELALQGHTQHEIASRLGLCPRSIRDYLRRLRRAPAVQLALTRVGTTI